MEIKGIDLQLFATPSSKNLLLGAGKVFFNRLDSSGNYTGLRHLGNVPKFDLKTEVEKITKNQSMYAARTVYMEVVKQITVSADITLEEFVPANLAMAMLGEEGTVTQTATAVVDEEHVAYPGMVIQTKSYNISNIVIKSSDSVTTYAAGTDYKVEASLSKAGLISIPEGSTMVSGDTVLVSYSKPAGTFATVASAVDGSVEGYMLFAGDPTKGPAYNADLWHVTITPNGSLALIGDDLASFDVTVTVMDDRENHPNEPLYRLIKLS